VLDLQPHELSHRSLLSEVLLVVFRRGRPSVCGLLDGGFVTLAPRYPGRKFPSEIRPKLTFDRSEMGQTRPDGRFVVPPNPPSQRRPARFDRSRSRWGPLLRSGRESAPCI